MIFCVTYFRPYLYGRKLTLVTGQKPLVWFQISKDPCSRVLRWRLKLAEYDIDVIYKAIKMNVNADALSRNPIYDNKEKSKYLQVYFYDNIFIKSNVFQKIRKFIMENYYYKSSKENGARKSKKFESK